jgi:hypothetical protein
VRWQIHSAGDDDGAGGADEHRLAGGQAWMASTAASRADMVARWWSKVVSKARSSKR